MNRVVMNGADRKPGDFFATTYRLDQGHSDPEGNDHPESWALSDERARINDEMVLCVKNGRDRADTIRALKFLAEDLERQLIAHCRPTGCSEEEDMEHARRVADRDGTGYANAEIINPGKAVEAAERALRCDPKQEPGTPESTIEVRRYKFPRPDEWLDGCINGECEWEETGCGAPASTPGLTVQVRGDVNRAEAVRALRGLANKIERCLLDFCRPEMPGEPVRDIGF